MLEVRKCSWNVKVVLSAVILAERGNQQGKGCKAKFIPRPFQAFEPLPGVLNVWKLDAGIKNRVYWPYWSQSVPPSTVVERKKSQNEGSAFPYSFPLSLSVRDVAANPLPQVPSSLMLLKQMLFHWCMHNFCSISHFFSVTSQGQTTSLNLLPLWLLF